MKRLTTYSALFVLLTALAGCGGSGSTASGGGSLPSGASDSGPSSGSMPSQDPMPDGNTPRKDVN